MRSRRRGGALLDKDARTVSEPYQGAKHRMTRALIAVFGLILFAASPAFAEDLNDAVLAELNFARTHPADYAQDLRREQPADDAQAGYPGAYDPDALAEAIDFLERQAPMPPLQSDQRIAAAALRHAIAQGPTGEVGHAVRGSASLSQRMQSEGVWAGLEAEDISYGYASPQAVVRQLIIDSGVAGRGHRMTIFDPTLQAAGVGCAPHRIYGAMCVIDFAGALVVR